jgi:outer membrane protein OmpA-like peptidoglycan-associated protein
MKKSACLALAAVVVAGCTTHADGTTSTNETVVGAAGGAVAGGVPGNRLDRDERARGTIIGAAAGVRSGYMMDRQESQLREQLATERAAHAVEVERVGDDLLKLTLANEVSFDVDSATIEPASKPSLSKVADVLKRHDSQVWVVGHTDSTGPDAYNQALSERRAETVRNELAQQGVPRSQMSATGRGETEPRADNAVSSGRAQNRRVEIFIRAWPLRSSRWWLAPDKRTAREVSP